jgi:hypothetical protein
LSSVLVVWLAAVIAEVARNLVSTGTDQLERGVNHYESIDLPEILFLSAARWLRHSSGVHEHTCSGTPR